METKTDRTAGTAATGSGGLTGRAGGAGPPPVRCTKEPGRPVPSGGLGREEAPLTGVLGCRLRGSEPGEGLPGGVCFPAAAATRAPGSWGEESWREP